MAGMAGAAASGGVSTPMTRQAPAAGHKGRAGVGLYAPLRRRVNTAATISSLPQPSVWVVVGLSGAGTVPLHHHLCHRLGSTTITSSTNSISTSSVPQSKTCQCVPVWLPNSSPRCLDNAYSSSSSSSFTDDTFLNKSEVSFTDQLLDTPPQRSTKTAPPPQTPSTTAAVSPPRRSTTTAKMWNSVTECCIRIASHFTRRKSVLVMSMAAAQDHAATLQKSVQQDTKLGFPHQVPRPDGEERCLTRKFPIKPEHEEQKREYIKPPTNKSVNDVGNEATHRPSLFSVYSPQGECGVGQCGASPLPQHHSSSSSSSSSLSQPGYGEEGRSSPRRQRKAIAPTFVPQYATPFSPKYQQHESSQRGGWPHGNLAMSISPSSHVPNNPLPYPSASNTLADITKLSVDCGPTHLSPSDRHTDMPVDSQAMSVGSLGVQQMGGPHRYRQQFTESPCSPSAESDDPPYSDVIDNSSLYNPSVSRPSEQRTKSGKI
ncbi:hypothetical protein Pcinc_023770 [Petrolisthes cinctipes]|uniref:Uncharacterized protein n=1 Tax=Petrolisthes cinctipes TaxID=88211 RepID=A0AAE1FC89_PETCI|nr:hypothetical protein Pcinc_023770 [Petrolisthes cinctipes]